MLTFRRALLFTVLATVGLVRASDRILVEARLNGQPLKLAFDTGAGGLIVFRNVAEQRGLKIAPPPADARPEPGKVLFSRTEPVTIELFGQTLLNERIIVIDLPSSLSPDIEGVLGWPNIRNNIWFLSGSALKLRLLNAVPSETASWFKLAELKARSVLCLEFLQKNPGPPVYLGIDTGSPSGVILSPEAWEKWRKAHPKQSVTLEATYMPGIDLIVTEIAWADEINIGGLTLRNVSVSRMNRMEQAIQPPGTVAILGLNAMLRMDAVLDGRNGFVYARPLNSASRPFTHNRLGAVFAPANLQSPNDLIAHVANNSPAAKAGVRDGDVLLKIDQLEVTPWRTQPGILPLRRFFVQAPGTKLRLTLRREGKTMIADVVLRNILGPAPE